MYTQLYGLSEKPFNLTPDPKYLYLTGSHREALASMMYGIKERKGFISIIGEVGSGKTTLIYTLLNQLDEKIKTVFISHTKTTFDQLLKCILFEIGLPVDNEDKIALLHRLNKYLIQKLSRDEIVALIIDEAQHLPKEVLEELRLLSNLETCKSKLLQIVLVGQPELESKLNARDLRQIKQRIGIRRYLRPLSSAESREYIEHRLQLAGSMSSRVFSAEALSLICDYAGGIPRTINVLCDNAFLIGYSARKKKIDAEIVREVISDMEGSLKDQPPDEQPAGKKAAYQPVVKRTPLYGKAAGLIVLLFFLGLFLIMIKGRFQSSFSEEGGTQYAGTFDTAKLPVMQALPSQSSAALKTDTAKSTQRQEYRPVQSSRQDSTAVPQAAFASPEERFQTAAAPEARGKEGVIIKDIVTAGKGERIWHLAQTHYQMMNTTLVDLILKSNPAITNVNLIKVDQQIKIPAITEDLLLVKLPDNTYKVHLGTFQTLDHVQVYYNEAVALEKKIEVVPLKVSPLETWYRVLLGTFDTKEESLQTLSVFKRKELLPCFSEALPPAENYEIREVALQRTE